jgi:hypothetical protein
MEKLHQFPKKDEQSFKQKRAYRVEPIALFAKRRAGNRTLALRPGILQAKLTMIKHSR